MAQDIESDEWAVWRPRIPRYEDHQPRPGRKLPPWPEGQDYFSMLEKHGKPHGPFDPDRQLPYRG